MNGNTTTVRVHSTSHIQNNPPPRIQRSRFGLLVERITHALFSSRQSHIAGRQLLYYAGQGNAGMVRSLLGIGRSFAKPAYMEARDKWKQTPLMRACASRHDCSEAIEVLLGQGADVNSKDKKGRTPLMLVLGEGKDQLVQAMIKLDANVNARDKNRDTPLVHAAQDADARVVKTLLEAGAKPNARNKSRQTALMWASFFGCEETVKALLEKKWKTDLDIRDSEGQTALFWAVESENPGIVKLLLGHRANPRLKDKKRRTALDIAKSKSEPNEEIIRLLEENSKIPPVRAA
ncbi:MAG: ankyrin repeat domain-containing protein [Candidatus Micrarchaeia archaeon]